MPGWFLVPFGFLVFGPYLEFEVCLKFGVYLKFGAFLIFGSWSLLFLNDAVPFQLFDDGLSIFFTEFLNTGWIIRFRSYRP